MTFMYLLVLHVGKFDGHQDILIDSEIIGAYEKEEEAVAVQNYINDVVLYNIRDRYKVAPSVSYRCSMQWLEVNGDRQDAVDTVESFIEEYGPEED